MEKQISKKEQLEHELFLLDMKDHLTPEDFTRRSEILLELRGLKDESKSSRIF